MTGSDGADKNESARDVPAIEKSVAKKAIRKAASREVRRSIRFVGLFVGFVAAFMTIAENFIDNWVDVVVGDATSEVLDNARKNAATIAAIREDLETMWASVSYRYETYDTEIPREQGSFSWRTDVETGEYRAAIVAGSYIYGSECDYRTVVKEIYMDRSDERWSLLVNKTRGCDRLRVDVVYVPSTWMDEVRSGGLERMLDRR